MQFTNFVIAMVSKKQLLELQTAGINVIFNYAPTDGYTTAPKFGINRKDVLDRIKLVFYLMIYISSGTFNRTRYQSTPLV